MQFAFSDILRILSSDPMHRGLVSLVGTQPIKEITNSILSGERFLIVTGFPILSASIGESDGPAGAMEIANALTRLGKTATIVTDFYSADLVAACKEATSVVADLLVVPLAESYAYCKALIAAYNPTHIITIERPSKAADGLFRNMHAIDISHMVADTDCFLENHHKKITTISIGDGGNECGMGNFYPLMQKYIQNAESICAVSTCDWPLVAGISNWWGWGIAAALSIATNQNLLLPLDTQHAILDAINQAGGVDGALGVVSSSVDGLDTHRYFEIYQQLWDVATKCIARAPVPV